MLLYILMLIILLFGFIVMFDTQLKLSKNMAVTAMFLLSYNTDYIGWKHSGVFTLYLSS